MSSQIAGPAPVSEKERERRHQRRLAVITLMAALLGATVGGGATFFSTREQVRAQQTQALKMQRQIAYVKMLTDNQAAEELAERFYFSKQDTLFTATVAEGISGQLASLIKSVHSDEANIQVIGTWKVVHEASNLSDLWTGVDTRIGWYIGCVSGKAFYPSGFKHHCTSILDQMHNAVPSQVLHTALFIDAARKDLGVAPLASAAAVTPSAP